MHARKLGLGALLFLVGLLLVSVLLVLTNPRARAVLRLQRGFTPLEEDARVYAESGAEDLALQVAQALPSAIERVETCQSRPFKRPFRVYVCQSHESFSRRIGQPADHPVRGIAFLRDVWISPRAFAFFGRDTHRQTLKHELSHLHLDQHLGWWRRIPHVPSWFCEGLANWVADTAGERVSRVEAVEDIFAGRQLSPDATGHLPLPKVPQDYGLTWPSFHQQSRMFLEYLLERNETAFRGFIAAIVDGERFEDAFREQFGSSVADAWQEFVESLRTRTQTRT